jgi:hypothetical protein
MFRVEALRPRSLELEAKTTVFTLLFLFTFSTFSSPSLGHLQATPLLTHVRAGFAQDTTRKARAEPEEGQDQEKKRPAPQAPPEWMWPRPSANLPFVQSPTELQPTFDELDSLSRLYPELKDALLRQAIVAGPLRD